MSTGRSTAGRSTPPSARVGGSGLAALAGRAAPVTLVASTLVLAPGALYRFTLPKLLLAGIAVMLAAWAPRAGRLTPSIAWTLAAGAGILLVAAGTATAPLAQLAGRWPRYEGLVALPIYAGAAWAGARLLGPDDAGRRRDTDLTHAAAIAAILLACVALAESVGLRPLGGDVSRPGALLGNASDLGLLGVLLLGVLLAAATRRSALVVAGACASVLVVAASGSRAAIAGAVTSAVVVSAARALQTPPDGRMRAVAVPAAAAVAVVVAAWALPGTRARITGTDAVAAASGLGRLLVWQVGTTSAAAHPLLGTGPSGFVDDATARLPSSWWLTQNPGSSLDSPHSWPLQAAVAGGIPLFVAALALVALVIAAAVTAWRHGGTARRPLLVGATAALAGYGLALAAHFTGPGTTPLAAALLGAIVARPPGGRRIPVWPWVGAMGVLVLVLVPAIAAEYPLDRAMAAAAEGDGATATNELTRAATERPWDADIDLIGGCALTAAALDGDQDAAAAAVHWTGLAVTRLPGSAEALRCRAQGYLGLGDLARAGHDIDRALALAPANPELLLLQGYTLAASGQVARAERPLLSATGNPSTAQRSWALLAQVYTRLDRGSDARHAADQAQRASSAG